ARRAATCAAHHGDRSREPPMSTPETETTRELDLTIGGMTCASCAARIEKRLNKLDGVAATVNYATEKARVVAPATVDAETLIAQVASIGYTAAPVAEAAAPRAAEA